MSDVKKCERCGKYHEPWTYIGRKLPDVEVKKRDIFGLFWYGEGDLCKSCAKELSDFMDGKKIEAIDKE